MGKSVKNNNARKGKKPYKKPEVFDLDLNSLKGEAATAASSASAPFTPAPGPAPVVTRR